MLSALVLSLALAQAVTGIVKDTSGAAVPGASVTVRTSAGTEVQTITGPDGRFTLDRVPDGQATLVVRSGGFAQNEQPLARSGEIEVVLSPAGLLETVTV